MNEEEVETYNTFKGACFAKVTKFNYLIFLILLLLKLIKILYLLKDLNVI